MDGLKSCMCFPSILVIDSSDLFSFIQYSCLIVDYYGSHFICLCFADRYNKNVIISYISSLNRNQKNYLMKCNTFGATPVALNFPDSCFLSTSWFQSSEVPIASPSVLQNRLHVGCSKKIQGRVPVCLRFKKKKLFLFLLFF